MAKSKKKDETKNSALSTKTIETHLGVPDDIIDTDDDWESGIAKPISDEVIEENKPEPKHIVKIKSKISYTISGLSNVLKKEAVKMLMDGVEIKIVADKFGVAPSDISILS